MSRRMLVPIVVILGLCWCTLVSLGLTGGPSFTGLLDLNAPSFQKLRNRFSDRLPVSQMRLISGDPTTCSLNSSRLTAPESDPCVYAIQPDKSKTRRLSLSFGTSGEIVRLILVQPDYLSVNQILKAGESINLDIFPNDQNQGAELTIKECVVAQLENKTDQALLYGCILEIEK